MLPSVANLLEIRGVIQWSRVSYFLVIFTGLRLNYICESLEAMPNDITPELELVMAFKVDLP